MDPKPNPDFTKLRKFVEETVKESIENEYWDDDNVEYIFEEVMMAMYGKGIFKKLDKIWK